MHSTISIANDFLSASGGLHMIKNLMSAGLGDLTNLIFFQQINSFLTHEISVFGVNLLGRTMKFVGAIALTLMTLWILLQGFRIVTGQSRDSMAVLVMSSLRATLIVTLATGWAIGGSNIFQWVGEGLPKDISQVVTGSSDDVFKQIDTSLGHMQLAFSAIDALEDGGDPMVGNSKDRAMWFTGIGTGGPAISAGIMLLLNRIALALFIGLGPIFILALMFKQTEQLFMRWLMYGIATMFSLAVLSAMVSLALKVVIAVAAQYAVGAILGSSTEGINSRSMQQGGLGLILTMLIVSAPPMAGAFFQGVLGNFATQTAFGGTMGSDTVRGGQSQSSQRAQQQYAVQSSAAGSSRASGSSNAGTEGAVNSQRPNTFSNDPSTTGYRGASQTAQNLDSVKQVGQGASQNTSNTPQSLSSSNSSANLANNTVPTSSRGVAGNNPGPPDNSGKA
jgi:type IV secretion system protein VirB6